MAIITLEQAVRSDQAPPSRTYRSDIQGLRAIAVSLVVIYHIWPSRLTGGYVGVDVFFVISGFLITGHLLKRPPQRGRDFAEFWARRIRRLLPAALLVVLVTGVATLLVAPVTLWFATAREMIACTFYVQNWVLAATSVDYLAEDNAPSPLQHFWSLSVEEQFYLVWPLLIALAAWWAGRRGRFTRQLTLLVIGMVVIGSLVISVLFTAHKPASAYFITPTRMWELGLGGLVAALPLEARRVLPGPAVSILAWAGVAAIVLTGFSYTAQTPFPGYTALLPTVGTAVVLWAHPTAPWSPGGILRLRPVQYIGDISYPIYLWHWPLVVLLPYVSGELGWLDRSAIVVSTVLLAAVTKMLVEDRFRRSSSPHAVVNAYKAAATGMVALGLVGAVWVGAATARVHIADRALVAAEANAGPCFGAGSMVHGFGACPQDREIDPVPAPEAAKKDKSAAYADGCWSNRRFINRPICTYGDGPVRVALVGNSHAGHWLPALRKLADERGWAIHTYLISQCALSDARQQFDTTEKSDNCYAYGQWVLDQTAHGQFDLIITSERQSVPVEGKTWQSTEEPAVEGYRSYLRTWTAGGTPIVVLHDIPYPGKTVRNIPDCLAEHPGHFDKCAGTPKQWHWLYPLATAAKGRNGVFVLNLNRYFCTGTTCPPVIGGVTVYFDSSHMTATYARTLAPYLNQELNRIKVP